MTSHPRSTVVLLDTGTPGTSREIFSEDIRFRESLQSGHAEIMSGFFPGPSANFELNVLMTPSGCSRILFKYKGDDLLVLFSMLRGP